MVYSYESHNFCAGQCGPNNGWWSKRIEEEINGVVTEKQQIFCPKDKGGCGRRLRIRNRDRNRTRKSYDKKVMEEMS